MDAEAIRKLIDNDPRPNHAYSDDVREAVGRYTRQRRDQGARWSDIERELGVSNTSAKNWMLALESRGFHEVVIVEPPAFEDAVETPLVITSPAGFILSGCSLEQAIVLLQRLG